MITLKNVSKFSDDDPILSEVSLEINNGDIIGVIGPSGGGKSTLLRCIAGIETFSSGEITISPDCRIGLIFQNFNIFENMTVIENLSYPQEKVLNRTREEAEGISLKMLNRINMMHCFNKYHNHLSSGQKQRIAIARTLCLNPSCILFDEPTSALDPESTLEIFNIIKDIVSEKVSMVIISHELRFIESITNKMIFMNSGKVEMFCDTKSFFNNNNNERIKSFLSACLRH